MSLISCCFFNLKTLPTFLTHVFCLDKLYVSNCDCSAHTYMLFGFPPIGKLFLIISNIVYLSLVRFKNGFVYSYFCLCITPIWKNENSGCTTCTLKHSAIFRSRFKFCRNNVFRFSGVCASLQFLSYGWWWGGG